MSERRKYSTMIKREFGLIYINTNLKSIFTLFYSTYNNPTTFYGKYLNSTIFVFTFQFFAYKIMVYNVKFMFIF